MPDLHSDTDTTPDSDTANNLLVRRRFEIDGLSSIFRILGIAALLLVGILQFNAQWRVQNVDSARAGYTQFLALSVSAGDLAVGPDPLSLSAEDQARYQAYVAAMATALTQALSYPPDAPEWVAETERQLTTHCAFFASPLYLPQTMPRRFRAHVQRHLGQPVRCG